MKEELLMMLFGFLLKRLSGEQLAEWADIGLDLLEDSIDSSDPLWDDKYILPLIQEIREGFGIEDGED